MGAKEESATFTHIRVENDGPAGRIMLNQGQMLNPLGPQSIAECRQALERFERDGVFVVELTGAGRAFCAGADLRWLEEFLERGKDSPEQRYDSMYEGLGDAQALVRALQSYPGVIVAVVNGPAVGGGVGLALAADITIAARSAYFGLPFVPSLGLAPDLGAISFLQDRIGSARTMAVSLLGGRLSAEEADQSGLIWACCEDSALATKAQEIILQLNRLPKTAVLAVKELVRKSRGLQLDEYLQLERRAQAQLFSEPEALAAITGLLAKHYSR
jgi:2-(1,2-epoxy-1,2-dihydrophenyl)acetyl-CoA isomerase